MFIKKPARKTVPIRITIAIIILAIIGFASFEGYTYINTQFTIQNDKQAEITRQISIKTAESAKLAKKREVVLITLPGAQPIKAIVEDYLSPSSIWAIVSKTHSISTDYIPSPIKIPNVATRTDKSTDERSVRSDIETPLINMFAAASTAGYQLMIGSGYRSAALQAMYFNNLAISVGDETANQAIARPGQSEHQTGLAIDISTVSRQCYLDNCFADTGDGQWLVNNAYKYGFNLRYPKGKETITGYQYEPWHFRYVGIDLATALYESNLTLDETWIYLEKADAILRDNGAI